MSERKGRVYVKKRKSALLSNPLKKLRRPSPLKKLWLPKVFGLGHHRRDGEKYQGNAVKFDLPAPPLEEEGIKKPYRKKEKFHLSIYAKNPWHGAPKRVYSRIFTKLIARVIILIFLLHPLPHPRGS